MKMKGLKILLFTVAIGFMQSCNNFLDIKPKGYTIPEFFDDYERLLASMNFNFAGDIYVNYLTDDIHLADKTVHRDMSYDSKQEEEKKMYNFSSGQIFQAGTSDRFWDGAYSRIFTLNAIINNVGQVTDGTANDRKRLRAEALAARAFEYLNLVNAYARHYNPATADKDYGVPLVLSEDISKSYVRNSVAEVYSRITEDLRTAIPDLRRVTPNLFRASRTAGHALLARTYLYMGDYEQALAEADSVLNLKKVLLDMNNYEVTNGTWGRVKKKGTTEWFPQVKDNPESIFIRKSQYMIELQVCASESLKEVFGRNVDNRKADLRYELKFAEDSIDLGRNWEKFKGVTGYAAYMELNMGMSTPEIYLIAAECEARLGHVDKALEHLKALRAKRIKAGQKELTAADKEEALKLVLDERRRELALSGLFRLIDLKRLEDRFKSPITHSADGESWTLPLNDNRLILPVPNTILAHNPNLPQYER